MKGMTSSTSTSLCLYHINHCLIINHCESSEGFPNDIKEALGNKNPRVRYNWKIRE